MKVKDLNGRTYNWQLGKYVGKQHANPSLLHLSARLFLKRQYPAIQILEEVYVPGEGLYLDFYIPTYKVCVECQGEQHNEYTSFFHKTKLDFFRSKSRDTRKHDWCSANGIKLVEFFTEETESTWQTKLQKIM